MWVNETCWVFKHWHDLTQINLHFMNASLGDWVSEFGKRGAFSQVHVSPMVFWLHCTHYCAVDCHKPNQSSWSSILSSCWQVTVSIVLFHFCAWLPVAVRRTCECQMTFASERCFFAAEQRYRFVFCSLKTDYFLFQFVITFTSDSPVSLQILLCTNVFIQHQDGIAASPLTDRNLFWCRAASILTLIWSASFRLIEDIFLFNNLRIIFVEILPMVNWILYNWWIYYFLWSELSQLWWEVNLTSLFAPCGLRVVRIDPLHFLARRRTRRLNQV